jgi:hypothetical protein
VKINEYFHYVQLPAYTAVEAMLRNGLSVHAERAQAQMDAWQTEMATLERRVESEAAKCGITLRYSAAHAPLPDAAFRDFLFRGLGLAQSRITDGGKPSTDDVALKEYAAVGPTHNLKNGQPFEDHPVVYDILCIRSLKTARGTHLKGLLTHRSADGCVHPKANWNLRNTTRLSTENPPTQQIPERANPEAAKKVKRCLVPRDRPWLGDPADWDPRKHGWCMKADIKGAEMVIRPGCIAQCRVLTPYIREGKDVHSKTSSLFYGQPEANFAKGKPDRWKRESVGKPGGFQLIFGGSWSGMRDNLWDKARVLLAKDEARQLHGRFFTGLPDIEERYRVDAELAWSRGYIEDLFGRRWVMSPPEGVALTGWNGPSDPKLSYPAQANKDDVGLLRHRTNHVLHCYANRPTQATQGSLTLWVGALMHHGEYVQLQVPPVWEKHGVPFPEAASWCINEGLGPGGKPFRAWTNNTVHDSWWLDGAPGYLEPTMKVVTRRCMGVPADFLYENDLPWRCELEVGPSFGDLMPYSQAAKLFNLEPAPEW